MTRLHTHTHAHAHTHTHTHTHTHSGRPQTGRGFPTAETVPAEVAALERAGLGHRNVSEPVPSDWTFYKPGFFLSINGQNMVNETNETEKQRDFTAGNKGISLQF